MTLRKKIKIAAVTVLGAGALLFFILIVHIAFMVKGRKRPELATIQMVRADFKQPAGVEEADRIVSKLKAMTGVKDAYYNPGSGILIYTFDATRNNANAIFETAVRPAGLAVEMKTFSKEELSAGCPAMDNNSFYGRLTGIVDRVVN